MAFRADIALVWVEGPDAARFLQGMLTSEVQSLAIGAAQPSLLLSAKGRIQGQLSVLRDGEEAFTLALPALFAEHIVAGLAEHLVSEDAEIIGPEPVGAVLIAATDARPDGVGDLVIESDIPDAWLVIGADTDAILAACGAPEGSPEALDLIRVMAGVPRLGVDFAVDQTLVQEAGLAPLVSFTKGCYLGQETVARLEHRGHANRQLRGLRLTSVAAPGADITRGGAVVGALTTVASSDQFGPVGLALIRHEVEPGATVRVGGSAAEVTTLPFVADLL